MGTLGPGVRGEPTEVDETKRTGDVEMAFTLGEIWGRGHLINSRGRRPLAGRPSVFGKNWDKKFAGRFVSHASQTLTLTVAVARR